MKEEKWKAFVTPRGHRRVRREDLLEFLKDFDVPRPDELVSRPHLVVDDENDVRELLTEVMKSGEESLEIGSAQGGVEALLLTGERLPELLILEILMPGMNEFEACGELKSNPRTRNVKIVAISGDTDPSPRARIKEAGADRFFNEPLNVLEIRTEVLKLFGF